MTIPPELPHQESPYVLAVEAGNIQAEARRLDLQHDGLRYLFDNRLILAPVDLQDNDKVLDIGCGSGKSLLTQNYSSGLMPRTAIWLLDMAQEAPISAELRGIDIETAAFPKALPPNVMLSQRSATDLPEEWSGKFTLVQNRMIQGGLTFVMWKSCLAAIYRTLKPGGWVQLGEWGDYEAGVETARNMSMVYSLLEKRGLLGRGCIKRLETLLQEAGFIDVTIEQRKVPLGKGVQAPAVVDDIRFILDQAFRILRKPIVDAGVFGVETGEDFDDRMSAMMREWDDMPDATTNFVVLYARKPF